MDAGVAGDAGVVLRQLGLMVIVFAPNAGTKSIIKLANHAMNRNAPSAERKWCVNNFRSPAFLLKNEPQNTLTRCAIWVIARAVAL